MEASSTDKIWGTGLSQDDPKAGDRSKWRGTNWLGEILICRSQGEMLNSDLQKAISTIAM